MMARGHKDATALKSIMILQRFRIGPLSSSLQSDDDGGPILKCRLLYEKKDS